MTGILIETVLVAFCVGGVVGAVVAMQLLGSSIGSSKDIERQGQGQTQPIRVDNRRHPK